MYSCTITSYSSWGYGVLPPPHGFGVRPPPPPPLCGVVLALVVAWPLVFKLLGGLLVSWFVRC